MPVLGEDGSWHLTTRGDTNFLARQFVVTGDQSDTNLFYTKGESLLSSTFDSSLAADESFEQIERNNEVSSVSNFHEEFADVQVHPVTGTLLTKEGTELQPLDTHKTF